MIRRLAVLFTCAALSVGAALGQTAPERTGPQGPAFQTPPPAVGTPFPSPPIPVQSPSPAQAAPPAATAAPAAAPLVQPGLVTFTSQMLDLRGGYVYFTTGDAFKLADTYRLVDYDTGQPTTQIPSVKWFARATLNTTTKEVIELAVTKRRVPITTAAAMMQLRQYALVASTPAPAPELAGRGLSGRPVSVVFEVTVPPTTSLTDNVYISTDAGGWNPQEIKLDRVNAYLYRAARTYASGTKFAFRVTRGSWNSVERGENNLDPEPHQFTVRDVDALAARVTVYHWSDDNPTQQGVGPNSIPTPYSANPFGGRNGIQVPQIPTAPPTPPR